MRWRNSATTRGAQLLLAAIERSGLPAAAVAKRIGVSNSLLWRWAVGKQRPNVDSIEKLRAEFRIAAKAWLEPARSSLPPTGTDG